MAIGHYHSHTHPFRFGDVWCSKVPACRQCMHAFAADPMEPCTA
jgi:hypothetical protein